MATESDMNRSQSIKNDSQERSNEDSDNSGSSLNKATVKLNLIKQHTIDPKKNMTMQNKEA